MEKLPSEGRTSEEEPIKNQYKLAESYLDELIMGREDLEYVAVLQSIKRAIDPDIILSSDQLTFLTGAIHNCLCMVTEEKKGEGGMSNMTNLTILGIATYVNSCKKIRK